MAKLYSLARVATATTGTGTITLGAAVSGFLSFSGAGVSDGDVVSYGIADGANSEVGTGTYTASGTTLTRTVTKSTNSNAAISLSGSAQVFVTARAEDIPNLDAWGSFTPTVTAGSGTFTTVSATMNYKLIGKTCVFRAVVTITTNGTAATDVRFTLPADAVPKVGIPVGVGRASAVSGKTLLVQVFAFGLISNIDGTYPGATGEILNVSGTYEVA